MELRKSILITDKVHQLLVEELDKDGFNVDYQPKLPLSETLKIVHNYCGLIVNSKTICDKKLIDLGANLKFIGRLGSGLEIIDLDYSAKNKIKILRTPEANCEAVAEHALGMLLSLFNNFKISDSQLKKLNWQREQNRGIEIRDKTIGIIGYGHTGPAFHELLKPFGAEIIIYDKFKPPFDDTSLLSQIKFKSDIISVHLPLTSETIGFVDYNFIQNCRNPFFLINTARGKNVIIKDLLKGLDEGKVLGACLDVFENEKSHTYTKLEIDLYKDLHNRPNVISTPHVAGWTKESLLRIAESMLAQIRGLKL